MAGFNFQQIAPTLSKYFNIDVMDIGRMIKMRNPVTGVLRDELIDPFIENIPCHFTFNRVDNADPSTMDVTPIIISGTINCDEYIDLQVGDLVTVRKLSPSGSVMATYKGVAGEPYVVQSRKRAEMEVRTHSETA